MSPSREPCESHLNGLKKYLVGVAVTLTTTLLVQSASLIWWASAITERVKFLEKSVDGLAVRVHSIETGRPSHP